MRKWKEDEISRISGETYEVTKEIKTQVSIMAISKGWSPISIAVGLVAAAANMAGILGVDEEVWNRLTRDIGKEGIAQTKETGALLRALADKMTRHSKMIQRLTDAVNRGDEA